MRFAFTIGVDARRVEAVAAIRREAFEHFCCHRRVAFCGCLRPAEVHRSQVDAGGVQRACDHGCWLVCSLCVVVLSSAAVRSTGDGGFLALRERGAAMAYACLLALAASRSCTVPLAALQVLTGLADRPAGWLVPPGAPAGAGGLARVLRLAGPAGWLVCPPAGSLALAGWLSHSAALRAKRVYAQNRRKRADAG